MNLLLRSITGRRVANLRPKRKKYSKLSRPKRVMLELAKLAAIYVLFSPFVAKPLYDMMLFHPDKQSYASLNVQVFKQLKQELGVDTLEFKIKLPDGNCLSARYFVRPGAKQTAIVSHGNAGNIDHRTILAAALLCCNLNVLLYDYEGYGASSGSTSIKAMIRDGVATYDYAVNELKLSPKNILVYGESIGTGVSVQISKQRPVAGIILQSGFSTLLDASRDFLFYLPMYPASWFENLDNVEILKQKHPPLLILHGDHDNVIALRHAQKLYREAAPPKQMIELKQFGHMLEGVDRVDFLQAVKRFADSTMEHKATSKV